MAELSAVCSGAMFQTCLDYLESSGTGPQCESVFLGPDVGFANIMVYNNAEGTCELSMQELVAACSGPMFQTCIDFASLASSEPIIDQREGR